MTDRTSPHLALSAHAHNRHGLERTDAAWLDEQWADARSRVLVVGGTRVRPRDGRLDWQPAAEVPPGLAESGTRVLLGERDGAIHFALLVDPGRVPGPREEWLPLRAVLGLLAEKAVDEAPMLMHAIGLAEWHWATRFCPRCAGRLESRVAGHELRCTECDKPQFPRTDPAVIMAVVHGEPGGEDERLLLGRQRTWPPGRWSTLAGFLEPGETLEDAVRREVREEVGIEVGEVTWFGSQPWPLPASLMVGFVARATTTRIDVDGAEIEEARWFTRDELRAGFEDRSVLVPRGVSISSSLIEEWYGDELGAGW